ncbi:MAG: acyl--CoA ligase [Bauldia sp.]|nr:acyl--CoA ligase [Bauldia sp.]
METISERFDVACRNFPNRAAIFAEDGEPVSFERLYYSIHSLAQTLLERGVQTGNIVSIHVADRGTRLALTLALMRIGAGAALFGPPLPAPGERTGVNFYIVDGIDPGLPDPRILRLDPSWLRPADRPILQRGVGGIITSTSGTTGFPKLQAFGENVLLARLDVSNRAMGAVDAPLLVGFNPSTSAGFQGGLIALVLGQTHIVPDRNPQKTLSKMAEIGARYARVPPLVLRLLLDGLRDYSGPVPKMKQFVVGGATVAPDLAAAAEEAFGGVVYNAYGSTESGLVSHFRVTDAPHRTAIVGRIRPSIPFRFLDDSGAVAPDGELHLKVPEAVRGSQYLNAEGPYDADGWVATGDVGTLDDDGNVVLTGRRAEFINAGGTKRAPELFEKEFASVPGVSDVAAFAVSNGFGSDDAGLVLVADRELVTERHIRAALAEGVRRGFVFRVFFADSIPRTAAGKLDRRYLSAVHESRVADLTVP